MGEKMKHMGRIKKIIYLVIIFVLGIFVMYASYNGNKYQSIYDIVDTAIKSEKYEEVAKTFGGCFDTVPIVNKKNENLDLIVYNGTSIVDVTYGEERSYSYEPTYYVYMFNVNYEYENYDGYMNYTSIIFKGENGQTYKYPFILSEYVNTELIETENFTKEAAILDSTRNVITNMETWNFMFVNVTKPMVEYVSARMGGTEIVGFSLTDNKGNIVSETDVVFDFSQKFYNDTADLITEYNIWLDAYAKGENTDEAEAKFNAFYEPWLEDFNNKKDETKYTFPYDSDYIVSNKVLWQTVGHMMIYALIMFAFYILFFHFDVICNIFIRIIPKGKKKKKETKEDKKEEVIEEVINDNINTESNEEKTKELETEKTEIE